MTIVNATEVGLDGVPPNTFFGNPVTDGINWAAHDPATLAENLRWTRMYMYWGNGLPGPYDNPMSILGGGGTRVARQPGLPGPSALAGDPRLLR